MCDNNLHALFEGPIEKKLVTIIANIFYSLIFITKITAK